MPNILLTEAQKRNLEELSQSPNMLFMHRARLILAYAEGLPTLQAAKVAGISRGRARYWKRQFISKGMDIFNPALVGLVQDDGPSGSEAIALVRHEPVQVEIEPVLDQEHVADEELAYPKVQKAIGIQVDDSLAEAGKKVWLYHFALMISHEEGTLLGQNIEELHDMRVATRRMRSAFEVFGEAFDSKLMKHYLKGLRNTGKALGQVRDMDVILEKGVIYQESLPEEVKVGLEPLLNHWRADIDSKRTKLIKHLESEKYLRFKTEFNHFVQGPVEISNAESPGVENVSHLGDIVPVMVYNRYAKVRSYDSVVPNATFVQLHALRIEFKKFRYTLEYFKEILGKSAGNLINEIKQYQDHLGELHDADVACQLVSEFLSGWEKNLANIPIPARVSPETIVAYLAHMHAERHRLMVSFPDLWKRFNRPEFRQWMAQAISNL